MDHCSSLYAVEMVRTNTQKMSVYTQNVNPNLQVEITHRRGEYKKNKRKYREVYQFEGT